MQLRAFGTKGQLQLTEVGEPGCIIDAINDVTLDQIEVFRLDVISDSVLCRIAHRFDLSTLKLMRSSIGVGMVEVAW